jgi:hypothetical protein
VVEEHGAFLGVVRGCEVGSRGDDVRVVRCVVDVFVVQMSLRTINTNIEIDPGSAVSAQTDEFHGISVIYLAEGARGGPKNERLLMLANPGWRLAPISEIARNRFEFPCLWHFGPTISLPGERSARSKPSALILQPFQLGCNATACRGPCVSYVLEFTNVTRADREACATMVRFATSPCRTGLSTSASTSELPTLRPPCSMATRRGWFATARAAT